MKDEGRKIFSRIVRFVVIGITSSFILHPSSFAVDLAEVYQKLAAENFAGKNIGAAFEGIEKLNPSSSVAATGTRLVVVRNGAIVGNWPRPSDSDLAAWAGITKTAAGENHNDFAIADAVISGIGGALVAAEMNDTRLITSAGVECIHDERGNCRVTGIVRGGPADTAGLRIDDIITEIDGKATRDMSVGDVASVLSGFNSGLMKMSVLGPDGVKKLNLRRATIVTVDADVVWRDPILEIIINRVSDNAYSIISEALAKYNPDGIILDLRTAVGSDERSAAKIAGMFVGEKPVFRIAGAGADELEAVPGGDALTKSPVVVVTANGTRAAAAGIASGIYENRRGVLIGMPTSDEQMLATIIPLSSGETIELNNKRLKSISGTEIGMRGLFPPVCISNIRSETQRDAFFVNILNGDFNAHDVNSDEYDADAARRGCPNFTSGHDEDGMVSGVAAKILTDKKVYGKLLK
ncbi:MAG: PDZ domain-containing protein [Rickettsiales bacterium]|jgi:C-terminal processing protease CtpA/Prc|nr:PDZ domain-containing protein [Rickettsiales bacterium]